MRQPHRPIGVIARYLGGYYFGGMLIGIQEVARKAGVPVICINQDLGDLQLPLFSSDIVAGWIVLHPFEHDRANLAALCAADKPVVMAPVPLEGSDCTLVHADNRSGMRDAVLHLIAHGHRRIAYVDHGPETWSRQRYLGYCDALDAHAITRDPALVLHTEVTATDGVEMHIERGQHAAQYLLAHDFPCTALVAPTDHCAITVMQMIQAAGRRVPDDLAVVGFDDMAEAQYTSPPLTTVRTQFETLGRAAAEQLLAEIRDGRGARSCGVAVPTTVLHRRSCGCLTLDEFLVANDANRTAASWQTTLLRQLVQVIHYPLPLDATDRPDQIWPGAGLLVAALDAALHAQQPPTADFEVAWRQAIDQTENLEILHTALTLLEDAAEQQLAAVSSRAAAGSAVRSLLRRMRLEQMRARVAYEVELKLLFKAQVKMNYDVSMALLRSSGETARSLAWLEHTPAAWGGLGLWDDSPRTCAAGLTVAGVYDREGTSQLANGQQLRRAAFPPLDQLSRSDRQGQDLIVLCPLRTEERDWGVLMVSGWAGQQLITSATSLTIQAALLGIALDRDAALNTLTEQQATLQEAYTRERMLSQTIRELGCPIIPLLPGVLLVPLIGAIDSERAEQIISAVLEAITAHQAQTVLLDVTGVPIVDTQVANSLIQTARAAMLLGARVVMVGIRPEIAQSIVGLGIDLQHLRIESTLSSAIRMLQIRRPS